MWAQMSDNDNNDNCSGEDVYNLHNSDKRKLCSAKFEISAKLKNKRRHSNNNVPASQLALTMEKACLLNCKQVATPTSPLTAKHDVAMPSEMGRANAFSFRAKEFERQYRLQHAAEMLNTITTKNNNFMCENDLGNMFDKSTFREHIELHEENITVGYAVDHTKSTQSSSFACAKNENCKTYNTNTAKTTNVNDSRAKNNKKCIIKRGRKAQTASHVREYKMAAEDDEGDVEYKWRLTNIPPERFEHLVTQMQFRVGEGKGQCLYELGVCDDGTPQGLPLCDLLESIEAIRRMAKRLNFEVHVLYQCRVNCTTTHHESEIHNNNNNNNSNKNSHNCINSNNNGNKNGNYECSINEEQRDLWCAEVMVSRRHAGEREVSVAFCGDGDSGKSTLMGVLLNATLDNGTGQVRQSLFNHKHEIDTGKTSSLATRVWSVSLDEVVEKLHSLSSTSTKSPLCNSIQSSPQLTAMLGLSGAPHTSREGSCNNSPQSEIVPHEHSEQTIYYDYLTTERDHENSDGAINLEKELVLPLSTLDMNEITECTLSKNPEQEQQRVASQDAERQPVEPTVLQKVRLITLIDLGGDITKTMLFGLMSRQPHYMCICVAATSKAETILPYLTLCRELRQLVMIVVTMIDQVEDFELDSFVLELADVLSHVGCTSSLVDNGDDLLECISFFDTTRTQMHYYQTELDTLSLQTQNHAHMSGEDMNVKRKEQSRLLHWHSLPIQCYIPIYCISSVAGGHGLRQFRLCLSLLSASARESESTNQELVTLPESQETCALNVNCEEKQWPEHKEQVTMRTVSAEPSSQSLHVSNKVWCKEKKINNIVCKRNGKTNCKADSTIHCNVFTINNKDNVAVGFEVLLDYGFVVAKVGNVVSGRVVHGHVMVGTCCYIGPDRIGKFHLVTVQGIHVDGVHVNEALPDDEACFALSELPHAIDLNHKGIVLSFRRPAVRWHFIAVIKVLSRSITEQLQPICYSRNVRQAVHIHSIQEVTDSVVSISLRSLIDKFHLSNKSNNIVTNSNDIPEGFSSKNGNNDINNNNNNINNNNISDSGSKQYCNTLDSNKTGKHNKLLRLRCTFMFRPEVVRRKAPVVFQWTPHGLAVGIITATCSRRKRAWR